MIQSAEQRKRRRASGGTFLIEDRTPEEIFTLEDLSPEQGQIAELATSFAEERIMTQISAIERKDYEVSRALMRELGELGMLGVDVPEEYGGLGLDKVTSTLVTDKMAVCGSFSVTFGTHVTIGTLPLVWYGTEEQKAKYLPKLASGEWIAAYALSESSAGSDAMNIRTKATLTPDGRHYVLNGEKMWISNAGMAGLFTVFAKIDGERFSAFLIERGTEGLTIGNEEHKLGIRGSSTCPLILQDCKVPVENLLGTAGEGHRIAFNILNVGRYKLAAGCNCMSKVAFRDGVRYARERVGFGKPVTSFGLVREKIAATAAGIYAMDSVIYRVVGAIDEALAELDPSAPGYTQEAQRRIEEFAAECSILKFSSSETLARAADDMLQLHGGYGYVEEFPAERTYRDARINRIFEGTNEINRLIATGWLVKRRQKGLLPREAEPAGKAGPLANAKALTLFCLRAAEDRFGKDLAEQQEVMGGLAEMLAEVLILESTLLRTEKLGGTRPVAELLAAYYAPRAWRVLRNAAEYVLGATLEGETLRAGMDTVQRLCEREPVDSVALGRGIAAVMVEAGQYVLPVARAAARPSAAA